MSSFEQLKQTFFDECGDLLQQIENGLTEIREGGGSDDTVNAVFRACHSIKGGAGIFGFETLVGFAHVFETVLDAIRSDRLGISPDNIDILLASSDVLADLVAMSRAGDTPPTDYGHECRAALQGLIGEDDAGGGAAADFDDIDFTPVKFEEDPVEQTYEINFRPHAELLKKGSEPLDLIRELRQMGEFELTADTDGLPSLEEIEFDRPYVGWSGKLKTMSPQSDVEAVFDFAAGDCELAIANTTPVAEFAPPPEFDPAAPIDIAGLPTVDLAPTVAPAMEQPPMGVPVKTAEKAEPGETRAPAKSAATTTRVELEKIDRVVNMVGELVIAQAMLGQIVHELPEGISARLVQTLEEVVHHTRELKDSVMSMRAQPVGAVFQRMPRLVRELSAKTLKKVRLEMA